MLWKDVSGELPPKVILVLGRIVRTGPFHDLAFLPDQTMTKHLRLKRNTGEESNEKRWRVADMFRGNTITSIARGRYSAENGTADRQKWHGQKAIHNKLIMGFGKEVLQRGRESWEVQEEH